MPGESDPGSNALSWSRRPYRSYLGFGVNFEALCGLGYTGLSDADLSENKRSFIWMLLQGQLVPL